MWQKSIMPFIFSFQTVLFLYCAHAILRNHYSCYTTANCNVHCLCANLCSCRRSSLSTAPSQVTLDLAQLCEIYSALLFSKFRRLVNWSWCNLYDWEWLQSLWSLSPVVCCWVVRWWAFPYFTPVASLLVSYLLYPGLTCKIIRCPEFVQVSGKLF